MPIATSKNQKRMIVRFSIALSNMYEKILKPIFFRFDPEHVHDFFVWFGELLGSISLGRWIVGIFCTYDDPSLHVRVGGLDFKNPVGLAAGFDKDVRLTQIMPSVGFGFMEVGAITHHPYEGNQGLRLARLPEDQSLIVYYGLKNIGSEAIEKKLKGLPFNIPIGINIAKTNRADIKGEKSAEDYAATYRMLAHYFAYVTLNISCPNAQDGCTFQDPLLLDELLGAIAKEKKAGPVFLKLSTHLTTEEVDNILAVVERYSFIDGFIIGNLSKRRDILRLKSPPEKLNVIPHGGISGAPVKEISTNLIRTSKVTANGIHHARNLAREIHERQFFHAAKRHYCAMAFTVSFSNVFRKENSACFPAFHCPTGRK